MKISNYEIQPILLHIPDEEVYNVRHNEMLQRLRDIGIYDTYSVKGIHAAKFGIIGTHPYELDNPNGGHMIGQKYVGSFLSQYVIYNVMLAMPNTHFMFFECDTVFPDGFMDKLEQALADVPSDFDFLFVHSCCAIDKRPHPVKAGSRVYKFPRTSGFPAKYPLSGSCYIISKKCLQHVIDTQRDAYAPADISLALHSFPQMDVYAILPRICEQKNNENLPQ